MIIASGAVPAGASETVREDSSSAGLGVEGRAMVDDLKRHLDSVGDLESGELERDRAESRGAEATGGMTDYSFGSSALLADSDMPSADAPGNGGVSLPQKYLAPASVTKNQGYTDTCWSFAPVAALETARLKQQGVAGTSDIGDGIRQNRQRVLPDYSEAQQVYDSMHATADKLDHRIPLDHDRHGPDMTGGYYSWGTWMNSATALADWEGVVNENDAPFNGGDFNAMNTAARRNAGKSAVHLESAEIVGSPWPVTAAAKKNGKMFYTRTRNEDAFTAIKQAIRSQGGVFGMFHTPRSWTSGHITAMKKGADGSIWLTFGGNSVHSNGTVALPDVAGWTPNADAGTKSDGSITTNHAVEIVVWDDTYSPINFVQPVDGLENGYDTDVADRYSGGADWDTGDAGDVIAVDGFLVPKHNGAWIIKNSWGADSGDDGYQYISYDDKTFWNVYQYQLEDAPQDAAGAEHEYNLLHQYDGVDSQYIMTSDEPVSEANVFTGQDETIGAVGVWTQTPNTDVRLDLYTGVDAGRPTSGVLARKMNVRIGRAGYHTVRLDSPLYVGKGERFSVVATMKARRTDMLNGVDKTNYVMVETGDSSEDKEADTYVTASAGQSFINADGKWNDVTVMREFLDTESKGKYALGNVMLKAIGNKGRISSATSPSDVSTVTGSAPVLPGRVRVSWSDGGESWVPVSWESVPASRYASPGSFVVHGSIAGYARGVDVRVDVHRFVFRDVSSSTPHASDIAWLADAGVSTGWREPDGSYSFRGMDSVKRQDMAAFLRREASRRGAAGVPAGAGYARFRDVTEQTPHADDIGWLSDAKVSEGWREPDGSRTFRGMDPVRRQDMAAFLRREATLMGVPGASSWKPSDKDWKRFRDVTRDTPHAEDVLWLAHANVSTGYADGTFGGMLPVYRQDMAAFLHRLDNLKK